MKKVTLIILICSKIIFSQNEPSYFKSLPKLKGNEPEWVGLMYSDNPNIQRVVHLYNKYYSENTFEKNIHTQNYKHWLMHIKNYIDEYDRLSNNYKSNYFSKLKNKHEKYKLTQLSQSTTNLANWVNVGPNTTYKNDGNLTLKPTQSNIYCIGIAPSNINIMYAATEGGGLFKTINKGLHWFSIAEDEIILNAEDIKVHPTNPDIVYLSYNKRIYKSVDGGANWEELIHTSSTVEQFYIYKTNPNIIFAATSDGLLKSDDAGVSWVNILDVKCWDIVPHATNPDIIYLSTSNSTLKRAEVYKSEDIGVTWNLKDTSWYSPEDINEARDIGCKLATTPADPNRVYACLIGESKADDNGWIGVYYSLDNADTWVNSDGIDGGPYVTGNDSTTNWFYPGYSSGYQQGWYNFDLEVSHTNPDRLWVGTIWFMESNNRGANLEYVRGTRNLEMHADIQDMEVIGDDIWVSSDGGLNYSNTECQTMETRSIGISGSTYWNFSQGWNEDTWTGGRYHNGNAIYHENFEVGNTLFLGGAESPTGYINPFDNRNSYYSDINDKKTPDALTEIATNITSLSIYPNQSYGLLNSSEIEYDPRYANHMYLGKNNILYKSIDSGNSFTALFNFPTESSVLEFDISRDDPNVIFCLVKIDGKVKLFKSTSQGITFSEVTIPFNSSAVDLAMDTATTNHVYIINYHGSNGNKVFETTDGGLSWLNKTTAVLDNHKIEDVSYQLGSNNIVYIVSDTGLFYWDENTNNWEDYSLGLPFKKQPLKMIPFYRDGKIRLSGGRGVWESPLADLSMPIAQPMTVNNHVYCHRKEVKFEDFSVLNHENASWLWDFPGAASVSSNTVRNPEVIYNTPGTYDVTLTITDGNENSDTKTVFNMITVNEDECAPDLYADKALNISSTTKDYLTNEDLNISNITHFTFTAWIKPLGVQANYSGIFSLSSGSGNEKNVLNFREDNNTLGFHWNGSHWAWDSNLELPENKWSFVAITVSPTEVKLYCNENIATRSINGVPFELNSIIMGRYYSNGSRNFNGLIDEATFYKRSLTAEEIYRSRHLTKQDLSDPDLIAYYQFNELRNGVTYDKKSAYDLSMVNAAEVVESSAPVGSGQSQIINVNSSGEVTFNDVGLTLNFSEGNNPQGNVVVSKIENAPYNTSSLNSINNAYWVINNYGVNNTFSPLSTISFRDLGNMLSTYPLTNLNLLKRNSNSDDSTAWQDLGNPTSKDDVLQQVVFDGSSISSFSQFYIGYDATLSQPEISKDKLITVYPNPVISGNSLYFKTVNEPFVFTLYNTKGKQMIRKKIDVAENVEIITNLPTGLYLYSMISTKRIDTGKLLVK